MKSFEIEYQMKYPKPVGLTFEKAIVFADDYGKAENKFWDYFLKNKFGDYDPAKMQIVSIRLTEVEHTIT